MISLEEAKSHLRLDDPDEDVLIQSLIDAAIAVAVRHLNRPLYASQDELDAAISAGAPAQSIVMNAAIRSAILLFVGHLYAHREAVDTATIGTEVPLGVRYILGLYRWLPGV